MLVRPKGPKPKGFLGAAKSTDELPFKIVGMQKIEHDGVIVYPYSGGLAKVGTCYTDKQLKEIDTLRKEGKILFNTPNHVFKVTGVITSCSKAESLGIPMSPKR